MELCFKAVNNGEQITENKPKSILISRRSVARLNFQWPYELEYLLSLVAG